MIPVTLQPEPPVFNAVVRIPGQQYLRQHPNARSSRIKSLWQGEMLYKLWDAYSRICAYLCIYIEFPSGVATVDHLVPKSLAPTQAYEWDNYRLACLGINRKKGTQTILDPIGLRPQSFFIEFSDGRIYPNPNYEEAYRKQCI